MQLLPLANEFLFCFTDDLTGNTGKKVIKSIVKRLSIFLIIFILSGLPGVFSVHVEICAVLGFVVKESVYSLLGLYVLCN